MIGVGKALFFVMVGMLWQAAPANGSLSFSVGFMLGLVSYRLLFGALAEEES